MEDHAVPFEIQSLVKGVYKALLDQTGGKRRRGQQEMIGAMARAVVNARKLDEQGTGARLLAANAPTGTGKTNAYAVGVVPVALALGLKVVISTSKVSLQEQIHDRDLAQLAKVVPEMKMTLVKGRARYACPVRMAEVAEADPAGDGRIAAELLAQLDAGAWSGDVDALPEHPDAQAWAKCTNDRSGCAGRMCSRYADCPYYRNRTEVEAANVLVTNHDLLLADLRAGNAVLPRPEDCVLVVDEAHTLPARAVGSLASGHALQEAQHFVMQCGSLVATIRRADRIGRCGRLAAAAMVALEIMGGALSEARLAVDSIGRTTDARDEKRPVRFCGGMLPGWLNSAATDCAAATDAASKALGEVMESLQGEDGDAMEPKIRERLLSEVGRAAGNITRIASVWKLMTSGPNSDGPIAKWVEISGAERDIRVCASPVGVGEYLHDALWSKVAAAVVVSGTLMTVGGMAPYLRASGLDRTPGVQTLVVDTPFNYAQSAFLVVPGDVCNPKDSQAHTDWLIQRIPQWLGSNPQGEGALVLFTSYIQLRAVADGMPAWVQEILLAQDRLSKREVLARHCQAIEEGRKSVIFATSAYEEGVDLPGRLCTLVVISKLPFAVPSDPVAQELRDHLESQGLSHFDAVVVPEACCRLVQSTGRLIRTETDQGCVVVADPRLTRTPYGRKMLATLPPYRLSRVLPLAA